MVYYTMVICQFHQPDSIKTCHFLKILTFERVSSQFLETALQSLYILSSLCSDKRVMELKSFLVLTSCKLKQLILKNCTKLFVVTIKNNMSNIAVLYIIEVEMNFTKCLLTLNRDLITLQNSHCSCHFQRMKSHTKWPISPFLPNIKFPEHFIQPHQTWRSNRKK